jgi:hypothetical protein
MMPIEYPPPRLDVAANMQATCGDVEPITMGVPFPKGRSFVARDLELVDSDGRIRAVQAKVLDSWSDGSIRWALLDCQTGPADGATPHFGVRVRADDLTQQSGPLVTIAEREGHIEVDTRAARFVLPRTGTRLIDRVVGRHGAPLSDHATLEIESSDGVKEDVRITNLSIEEAGALRSAIRIQGHIGSARKRPLLEVDARLHFFAGLASIRFEVTVRNPRKATHRGGFWDLGDEGSVYVKDLSFRVGFEGTSGPTRVRCSAETDAPWEEFDDTFELYQDSSGGENWRSENHVTRRGEIAVRFRGYQLKCRNKARRAFRATPIVSMARGSSCATLTMPQFWQNFPKSIDVQDNHLYLRLFPRQCSDLHELQGGEQKTHTFFASFGDALTEAPPMTWTRTARLVRATPHSDRDAGMVPFPTSHAEQQSDAYLKLVNTAIDNTIGFASKREIIDEYGWRHFGDIYADHEAVGAPAAPPLISHYNNQYDAIAGFAYQFLRTGDRRWWSLMCELADHVIDIDVYHTALDKSAYNHGLFWHTNHYLPAGTATHRCYSRSSGGNGGGPSAEHNYTTGLMLHYFLTGDTRSRDTAVDLARFVVDIDDGAQTPFRWLARGETGLATASGSMTYHGPGRAAGNSLNALLDGHRLTGDSALLDKADAIIKRVVHPEDDIDALDLLDAERRWFYTVFLQSLAKYLDYKDERGLIDATYFYASASLLHYARWMAEHEYPYLDKPEILEYPNETWAAQDMRKSEVFLAAAKYADSRERERFLERAHFFFHYSVTKLSTMPTATLARPIVLLLRHSAVHEYFAHRTQTLAPQPATHVKHCGMPQPFVPQKIVAMERAKRLVYALGTAMAGALTWWLL